MSEKENIVNAAPNDGAARQVDSQQTNNNFGNNDSNVKSYETGIEDLPHTNIDLNRQTNVSSEIDVAVSDSHVEGAGLTFVYGTIDCNEFNNVKTCFPIDKEEDDNLHNFSVINENESVQ